MNQDSESLLKQSAIDMISALSGNSELSHVKQMAFGYYNSEQKEHYQVQVTVTRREDDFLDDFEVEEMWSF